MRPDEAPRARSEAAVAVAPFVALGLADVLLLLGWGLDPLWGFIVLPPILFVSALGWIAFRGGLVDGRAGDDADPDDPGSTARLPDR